MQSRLVISKVGVCLKISPKEAGQQLVVMRLDAWRGHARKESILLLCVLAHDFRKPSLVIAVTASYMRCSNESSSYVAIDDASITVNRDELACSMTDNLCWQSCKVILFSSKEGYTLRLEHVRVAVRAFVGYM